MGVRRDARSDVKRAIGLWLRDGQRLYRRTEMGWFWQSDKPAEELVEKIDEVMEPYRKTPPPDETDASIKRNAWEESVLKAARERRDRQERFRAAARKIAAALKEAGLSEKDVAVVARRSAMSRLIEAEFNPRYPDSATVDGVRFTSVTHLDVYSWQYGDRD